MLAAIAYHAEGAILYYLPPPYSPQVRPVGSGEEHPRTRFVTAAGFQTMAKLGTAGWLQALCCGTADSAARHDQGQDQDQAQPRGRRCEACNPSGRQPVSTSSPLTPPESPRAAADGPCPARASPPPLSPRRRHRLARLRPGAQLHGLSPEEEPSASSPPPPPPPPDVLHQPESFDRADPAKWAAPAAWLQFPAEIRNMIYNDLLHWPDSPTLYRGFNRKLDAYYRRKAGGVEGEPFPIFDGKLNTPTILLLCQAITRECLSVLRQRRLGIDRLPPWNMPLARPRAGSRFLGRQTLQNLPFLDVHISICEGTRGSGWAWFAAVADLFDILMETNSFLHLRVIFRIGTCREVWYEELEVYRQLMKKVGLLSCLFYETVARAVLTWATYRSISSASTAPTSPTRDWWK